LTKTMPAPITAWSNASGTESADHNSTNHTLQQLPFATACKNKNIFHSGVIKAFDNKCHSHSLIAARSFLRSYLSLQHIACTTIPQLVLLSLSFSICFHFYPIPSQHFPVPLRGNHDHAHLFIYLA
jgi:hypothetical protein